MNPDLLRLAATAAYGPRFQRALSQALHVNERTIRAWLAGKYKPPAGIVDDLEHILQDRAYDIESALRALWKASETLGGSGAIETPKAATNPLA